jgi:hypothetical protein
VQIASRISLISTAHAAEVTHPARYRPATWIVQVGTFSSESAARSAALKARREAEAGEVRVEPIRSRGRTVWRAQVIGLTASDAQDTCSGHRKSACMARPDGRQVASR